MAYEKRITKAGFIQYREVYDDGTRDNWRFEVVGFCGQGFGSVGTCNVLTVDGERNVPIDATNRIKINNKWHSQEFWHH